MLVWYQNEYDREVINIIVDKEVESYVKIRGWVLICKSLFLGNQIYQVYVLKILNMVLIVVGD